MPKIYKAKPQKFNLDKLARTSENWNQPGAIAFCGISVGQTYFDSPQSDAYFNWVIEAHNDSDNSIFNQCKVVVGDTLQRHNLLAAAPSLSEKEAYDISLDDGDKWLLANQHNLHRIVDNGISLEIIRWDDILKTDAYELYAELVHDLYEGSQGFKPTVEADIDRFLDRACTEETSQEKRNKLADASRRYFLEEIPAFAMLWGDEHMAGNTMVQIYPRDDLGSMTGLRTGFTELPDNDLLSPLAHREFVSVRIDSKKIKENIADEMSKSSVKD